MRKLKKPTVKSLSEKYDNYRKAAQEFMFKLQHPSSRNVLSVEAADAQGKLNGITIVELIAITNLLSKNGEKLYFVPQGKAIVGYAVKDPQPAPLELL
jgi:hypothetical protein